MSVIRRIRPRRNLINKKEDKSTWLQVIGFFLILIGVLYLLYNLFWYEVNSADIAINFFIIMLGFAFAFPDLLQDQNKGLSTMRIAVFMILNVICMLLLKIGWDSKNLTEIGVNQYWVGIIAFVFGAKAVQTFFESKETSSIINPKTDSYDNTQPSTNINRVPTPGSGPVTVKTPQ